MTAIFEHGGKQYTAEVGDVLEIAKTDDKVGSKLVFDKVLSTVDGEKSAFGAPYLSGKKVEAEILKHDKYKKIVVYKYKKTKGYHKKQGHRQDYTQVKITKIS
ncbi:50S ribosomal protein L21 [Treponema sp. R6D11]